MVIKKDFIIKLRSVRKTKYLFFGLFIFMNGFLFYNSLGYKKTLIVVLILEILTYYIYKNPKLIHRENILLSKRKISHEDLNQKLTIKFPYYEVNIKETEILFYHSDYEKPNTIINFTSNELKFRPFFLFDIWYSISLEDISEFKFTKGKGSNLRIETKDNILFPFLTIVIQKHLLEDKKLKQKRIDDLSFLINLLNQKLKT